jgi:hypothetical protein
MTTMTLEEIAARVEELSQNMAMLDREMHEWSGKFTKQSEAWFEKKDEGHAAFSGQFRKAITMWEQAVSNQAVVVNAVLELLVRKGVLETEEVVTALAESNAESERMMADALLAMSSVKQNPGGSA